MKRIIKKQILKPYYENEHGKLYHGDCLEVMPKINIKFDMVLCDPPYGTTQNKWDSVIPLTSMWSKLILCTNENSPIILTSQSMFTANIQISSPFYRYSLIWEKSKAGGFLNANRMPLQAHEDITVHYKKLPTYNPQKTKGDPYTKKAVSNGDGNNYGKFERKGETKINDGDRFPRSVIKFSNDNHNSLHPTQKPVDLFSYLIKTYTNEGETILDFAAGSGTTAVAAQENNRKWVLIEKEEKYCEIIKNRLQGTL